MCWVSLGCTLLPRRLSGSAIPISTSRCILRAFGACPRVLLFWKIRKACAIVMVPAPAELTTYPVFLSIITVFLKFPSTSLTLVFVSFFLCNYTFACLSTRRLLAFVSLNFCSLCLTFSFFLLSYSSASLMTGYYFSVVS